MNLSEFWAKIWRENGFLKCWKMVICDELGRAKIWGLKKGTQKFSKGDFSREWNFATWENGAWEILRLIYRIAKFLKSDLSGVWTEFGGFWLYKTRRTDYWMQNLWIFLFLLGFLWLITPIFCVARLFVCGVGFLRDGFCEADGSTLTRCFKATRWILRFWEFLEFVMNFKEF